MASTELWSADTAEPWVAVQHSLPSIWRDHASERLQELNRWYEQVLPSAISSRAPELHITGAELVQLVDWKLNYGKWRPRLLDFAKAAAEDQVQDASRKAFALLLCSSTAAAAVAAPAAAGGRQKRKQQPEESPKAGKRAKTADASVTRRQDEESSEAAAAAGAAAAPSPAALKAALDALTVLKGVGPATASAVLAAADVSGSVPYMGDEALTAACGGRDYTAKAYLQLLEALRDKADWLAQQDPGTGWTAVLVERCLYAAALQTKGGGAAAAAGKASKAAKSSSRKGQKG